MCSVEPKGFAEQSKGFRKVYENIKNIIFNIFYIISFDKKNCLPILNAIVMKIFFFF